MKSKSLFLFTVFATLVFLGSVGSAETRTYLEDSVSNVIPDNKAIISEFFERFSAGQIEAAFSLVDDQVKWWVPETLLIGGIKSKTEYMQIVGMIKQGFPNLFSLNVKSMVAEGDRVAVEVESLGTHKSGKIYNNKYHFLIVVRDGKFVDVKEYMDTLHLFQLIQK